MKRTLIPAFAAGVVVMSSVADGIVGIQCSQQTTRRGPASSSVVLSLAAGSPLLSSSHGDARFRIQGNRRLGFSATGMSLVADGLPSQLELALVANDETLAAGDMCSGIGDLPTKRLTGETLARVFGLPLGDGSCDRPQLVVRVSGSPMPLLAGALGEPTLRPGGCANPCRPALTFSCRASASRRSRRANASASVARAACKCAGRPSPGERVENALALGRRRQAPRRPSAVLTSLLA